MRALPTTHVVTSSLSQDLVLESNSYKDTAPRVQHFSAFHVQYDFEMFLMINDTNN